MKSFYLILTIAVLAIFMVPGETQAQTVNLISPENGAQETINSTGSVTFNYLFSGSDIVSNYRIQVSDQSNFSNIVKDATTNGDASYTFIGLDPRLIYYWRVMAEYIYLFNPRWSNWSVAYDFRIIVPELLSPNNFVTNQSQPITFEWRTIIEGPILNDGMMLQFDDNSDFSSPNHNSYGTSAFRDISFLEYNKTYYWRVCYYTYTGSQPPYIYTYYDWSVQRWFSTGCDIPGATTLVSPANNASNQSQPVALLWSAIGIADEYNIQITTIPGFSSNVVDEVVGSASYSASGLEDGTAYYWRVRAGNECGWSDWSDPRVFTTECPVPNPPILALPTDGAIDVSQPVTWDWNDVSEATKYHIQVDNDNADFNSLVINKFNILTSDFTYDGLADATDYWWRVRSGNDCGWSDWSDPRDFTTECPVPNPPILALPTDGAIDVSQPVTWDWNDVSEATKYHIQVDNDNADFNSLVINKFNILTSDFTWDGLADATNYYWRVRSGNDCGSWSDWSDYRSFTTDCPVPDPPILELPADGATDVSQPVTWDWNDVSEATKYHIQIDNESSDFNSVVVANESRTLSFLTYDGLLDATEYWWRVRSGNDCGWSDWSLSRSFTTDCPVPEPPTLELPEDGATVISQPVMWDWSDVSEATKYHIQVDKVDSDFNNLVITKFNILTSDFTYDGLADGTDYWWRVRSGNDCGSWSDWSLVFPFSVDEQTDVTEISSEELPSEFTLSQNYPNPFNPVTNIDFALPRAAHVRIEVFNILGSRVSTLVDEYLSAGYKSVEWDGRSNSGQAVSSGVYLFRITAGEFSASRKAVLMK